MDVTTDAVTEYVKEATRNEEEEIYAAWRSDYDYLHVYGGVGDGFILRRSYVPCNTSAPARNHLTRIYDLREENMSPAMRDALRNYNR